MKSIKINPAVVTIAVLCTVGALTALVATNAGTKPRAARTHRAALAAQPVGPPAEHFAVLRRARRQADTMPDAVRVQLETLEAPVASARTVDVGKDSPGWLMASDTTMCLSVPYAPPHPGVPGGFGSVCAPAATVDSDGISDVRVKDPAIPGAPEQVYAVLPDEIQAVTVERSNGDRRTAVVKDNVIVIDGSVGDHVYYHDAAGAQHDLASQNGSR